MAKQHIGTVPPMVNTFPMLVERCGGKNAPTTSSVVKSAEYRPKYMPRKRIAITHGAGGQKMANEIIIGIVYVAIFAILCGVHVVRHIKAVNAFYRKWCDEDGK